MSRHQTRARRWSLVGCRVCACAVALSRLEGPCSSPARFTIRPIPPPPPRRNSRSLVALVETRQRFEVIGRRTASSATATKTTAMAMTPTTTTTVVLDVMVSPGSTSVGTSSKQTKYSLVERCGMLDKTLLDYSLDGPRKPRLETCSKNAPRSTFGVIAGRWPTTSAKFGRGSTRLGPNRTNRASCRPGPNSAKV